MVNQIRKVDSNDNLKAMGSGNGAQIHSGRPGVNTEDITVTVNQNQKVMDDVEVGEEEETPHRPWDEEEPEEPWYEKYLNKGDISNCITAVIAGVGLFLVLNDSTDGDAAEYIFAFGLFGFSGGITNWLAVKMLFDKVPGLIGSGVIPERFEEIRAAVKNTIMRTFFDQGFIKKYVKEAAGDIVEKFGLQEKITKFLMSEKGEEMLMKKMGEQRQSDLGLMLAMVNIDIGGPMMVNKVRQELVIMAGEIGPLITALLDPEELPIDQLRDEVNKLMTAKLNELDADKVKILMEEVIRKHLGWLVVWGNVFGGVIGIISKAAGYGSRFG